MKYLLSFITIACYTLLQASLNYPVTFSSQGTVLYKSAGDIVKLQKFPSYKNEVSRYLIELEDTKNRGFKADKSDEKKDKIVYLKVLRDLQVQHDRILQHSMQDLNAYIDKDDYRNFLKMVNIGMPYYSQKLILKEKVLSYYEKNKARGKSKTLDKMIRENKSIKTYYSTRESVLKVPNSTFEVKSTKKEIVLLSRPGCGYCVKAKSLLDSTGNSYKEYNINQPKGSELFKKYNGTGVPIVVIGDKVLRGFNANVILAALK